MSVTANDWLDPQVPDDRIIAATLDLQARYPSNTVVLLSRDRSFQNKAVAVGIPIATLCPQLDP